MNLSLLFSLLSTSAAIAPEIDKRDAVIVEVTRTVDDIVSVISVVAGQQSIVTHIDIETSTTTTTKYTSTFTSTIFGQELTFVSVIDSKPSSSSSTSTCTGQNSPCQALPKNLNVQAASIQTFSLLYLASSTEAQAPQAQQMQQAQQNKQTLISSTSSSAQTSPATSAAPLFSIGGAFVAPDYDTFISDSGHVFPLTSDGYVLQSVRTSIAMGSICIVHYDYSLTGYTETVTSVSTMYSTVTL